MAKEIISQGYNSLAEDCSSKLDTPSASQIIIDGVDVSGCKSMLIANDKVRILCQTNSEIFKYCEDNENCYFKQMKRKEQELEEQKLLTKEISDVLDKLNYEIRDLKAENKKLKEELDSLRQSGKKDCAYCVDYHNLEMENSKLKEEKENCKGCSTCNEAFNNARIYAKEYRRYKQALDSISDIIHKTTEQPELLKEQE